MQIGRLQHKDISWEMGVSLALGSMVEGEA
jgi:hypothetical protein